MNWLAIANPAAGRRGEVARALERLRREAPAIRALTGTHPGDAARLAREAAAADGLVVLGGDGSIAEVVNAMDRSRQVLAVLPCGHGNCLARDLGVADVDTALRALRAPQCLRIDLMRVSITAEGRPPTSLLAASTLAVGYVADTVILGRARFSALGRHAYAAASLLTRPRPRRMQLDTGREVTPLPRLTGVIVNNTAHLANFRAFLDARIDDGLLDVMEQSHGWLRQVLHNASILAGSRAFGPARLSQAKRITLLLAEPETVMVDGEMTAGVTRIEVRCEAQALACIHGPARAAR